MRLAASALLIALAFATGHAHAEPLKVGLATTLDESTGLLGRQMRDGAQIAAREAGVELVVADDSCSAEGGEAAARLFIEEAVTIVVGFLCSEAIEAALPILTDAAIPVITPGVRADGLTDRRLRTGWLVWRLAPRADAEREQVSALLPRLWRETLFAIVDDGTIYGRELAESLRLAVETAALRPVFVDTYRPQSENQIGLVGRLGRAGATHVFVGGDRDDIAIMGRAAAELGIPLVIAGGEALRAAGEIPLPPGTLMVALPEWADLADEGVMDHFAEDGVVPEGYVLPGFAAVEVAVAAARTAADDGRSIADVLAANEFQTLLGPLRFNAAGDLAQNPFRLFRFDGERFLPAE